VVQTCQTRVGKYLLVYEATDLSGSSTGQKNEEKKCGGTESVSSPMAVTDPSHLGNGATRRRRGLAARAGCCRRGDGWPEATPIFRHSPPAHWVTGPTRSLLPVEAGSPPEEHWPKTDIVDGIAVSTCSWRVGGCDPDSSCLFLLTHGTSPLACFPPSYVRTSTRTDGHRANSDSLEVKSERRA